MPLILTQNESTASGHRYADELGIAYEYPARYRNTIRPGEPFVYYRGRRRTEGAPQPQVYLGTGVVGTVAPSENVGRLICTIEDYEPFQTPLPFKSGDTYLEPLGNIPANRAGLYFRRGVRQVTDATFAQILASAAAHDPTAGRRKQEAGMPWAPPEVARLVDEIAMEIAVNHLEAAHSLSTVARMPHNNPGYDIRIETDGQLLRFVEVKGTIRPLPHFFMSEGERLFSHMNASKYSLLLIYDIDKVSRTGSVLNRDGAVIGDDLAMHPTQWEGALSNPSELDEPR